MTQQDAKRIASLVEFMVAQQYDQSAVILKKLTKDYPEMGTALASELGFTNHPEYRQES